MLAIILLAPAITLSEPYPADKCEAFGFALAAEIRAEGDWRNAQFVGCATDAAPEYSLRPQRRLQ